jgi:hypothetical protein
MNAEKMLPISVGESPKSFIMEEPAIDMMVRSK